MESTNIPANFYKEKTTTNELDDVKETHGFVFGLNEGSFEDQEIFKIRHKKFKG